MDQTTTTFNGKAVKFRTLAEKRVTKTLKGIRQIGALANRNTYDYGPEQVAKMFDAIHAELDAAERRFAGKERQAGFSFD